MQEKEIQQLQKTISTLKELLRTGENYVQMDDLVAVTKATKKAMDEIRDDIEKVDVDTARKITKVVNDFHSEIEKHVKKCSENEKKMDKKMESIRAEIPSLDLMTERHNDMEFELARVDDKISESIKPVKGEISQLQEELKQAELRLSEELKKASSTRAVGGGSRRVYQPYLDDFSAQTDGVTKTFYLSREPLKTNTILVWGTDFPIILRPTTDFTVAGKTLTLTSAVPAPSQGATLLIQYHA